MFLFCKAASRLWQVFWVIRLPLLCHLYYPSSGTSCHLPARSIATSPLWLKTVACGLFLRCFAPPRRAPEGEGFKTVSRSGQVFGVVAYVCLHFSRRGFLDGEPPPAGGLARVRGRRFVSTRLPRFARNDIGVRFAAKPSVGRDSLIPPPVCLRCHSDRSKDGCPYAVEKSLTVEVLSPCALRPSSLPGDCRVATAPRNDSGDTGARSVLSTVAYSAIPIILSFRRTKRRRGSRRANRA